MLSAALTGLRRRVAADERGFTLVELLVAMVAGTVILLSLFTLLDVTMRQTSTAFTTVDATQNTRVAIEKIESELHSACMADGITPIQSGSDGTHLWFISQWGAQQFYNSTTGASYAANATSPTPVEHELTFDANSGNITDNVFKVASGSSPSSWTFSSTAASTSILASNVSAISGTDPFQYFAYQNPGSQYTDSGGNQYEMLIDGHTPIPGTSTIPTASPLSTPLSSTDAQNAAEVLVSLVINAHGGSNENTTNSTVKTSATISDQIVLRLTPPANHIGTGTSFTPCS
jgi:prepilin-type N-terminal cleavage/methylation domain-containing protein